VPALLGFGIGEPLVVIVVEVPHLARHVKSPGLVLASALAATAEALGLP
jgi:hypothetical protein